ncbi:hypothetical protein Q5P01_019194 [Channa striata]|uniref:Fibronectin type-III domain-containing protein n=1 Tax=Channa striata TaxID=64152 RepID=A0AA88S4J9_CHASR|nr:hypothetical protein Q5P01_019194 [Channa striata]
MSMRLLLLLCLTGHVFAKEPPDVNCLVLHLEHVKCTWNEQGTPEVNYTFNSRFHYDNGIRSCKEYILENNITIGCIQPYGEPTNRFNTFYTNLVHGEKSFPKKHELKNKVLLNPPVNLTVLNGSDSNLWFYWNQISKGCVESEVRFRTNHNKWETSKVSSAKQNFCINLPSSNSRYEVQVRSKITTTCGESLYWSDWSEPVVWGSNNSTDINHINVPMSVWTPVLYVLGGFTLVLLVIILLQHERLRIILIPVVPKQSLIPYHDIENWLHPSKGLNFENFKANYNERACSVREYCQVSRSDSESSDDSNCSVNTDQTDCSVSTPTKESEDLSTPCSSSSSAAIVPSKEEQHVSV